jgi:hypothetical protein
MSAPIDRPGWPPYTVQDVKLHLSATLGQKPEVEVALV